MMIAKKTGTWHSPHEHRESRRRHAKLEGWPDLKIHSAASEPSKKCASEYPLSSIKIFEQAMIRCPSISMDIEIMQGQPCILGTRIPVRAVLRALEQYGSVVEVKNCYPHLTTEQVEDALWFSQLLLELPSGLDETAVAP
jgi:uncharacterized protein (DUF433 family)